MNPREQEEQRAQYIRALFDTIPSPAFVVDADVRIHDFNTAAEQFLGDQAAATLHQRGGEAFHCLQAESRECGRGPRCKDCVIRNCVGEAMKGRPSCRVFHRAELRRSTGTIVIDLLVTASVLPYTHPARALVILEDISEFRRRRVRRKPVRKGEPVPLEGSAAL